MKYILGLLLISCSSFLHAQLQWVNMDSVMGPLPASIHVYKTTSLLDGKPNIAWYVEADLTDKHLSFEADTTLKRRLTPNEFYQKNDKPYVVVNTTFFSFATNQNLNAVIKEGKLVGYNIHSIPGKGKDTLTYRHPIVSAIGISKRRKADVAFLYTDSSTKYARYFSQPVTSFRNADSTIALDSVIYYAKQSKPKKWKMQTAVGGGPSLLNDGQVRVSNNEELKFGGKAIDDKHPRTLMGYTKDRKLIIVVIEGRNPGIAEGATLTQEAQILKDLGCVEGLNLDGGGSSCMLVNGKETIAPSDKKQRPVPCVLVIGKK